MSAFEAATSRAAAFVSRHGGELANQRLAALRGALPADAVIAFLAGHQHDDGSIRVIAAPSTLPQPAGDAGAELSGVAGTLAALAALDELACLRGEVVERACAFLTAAQCKDGSWSLGAQASERERLPATGLLAGYLGKTRCTRADVIEAAARFVADRFTRDELDGRAWPDLAATLHCMAIVPEEESDAALAWCGRALERGYRAAAFDAVQVAQAFVLCDAHALPGIGVGLAELVQAIVETQADDGGWQALGRSAPSQRVEHTLAALTALSRLARAAG